MQTTYHHFSNIEHRAARARATTNFWQGYFFSC